jgi:branched-chain amino acid transport system permease protein
VLDQIADFYATYSNVIHFIGLNAILGISLYLTLSVGLLSLANAAFMGIGAYTAALLTMRLDWPFAAVLVAGALMAALIALLLGAPVLRLRGVFLAISTIGFGEVVRILFVNWSSLTGGPLGLVGIPQKTAWWHIYLLLGALLYVLWRVQGSRTGWAMKAIRENETTARTAGINPTSYKLAVFVAGAFVAGLAGGLEAHLTFIVEPKTYGFTRAVEILTFAAVGGMGTFVGPLLGATLFTILPEFLRTLRQFGIDPGPPRLFLSGVILLVIMLLLPRGLIQLLEAPVSWLSIRRPAQRAGTHGPVGP